MITSGVQMFLRVNDTCSVEKHVQLLSSIIRLLELHNHYNQFRELNAKTILEAHCIRHPSTCMLAKSYRKFGKSFNNCSWSAFGFIFQYFVDSANFPYYYSLFLRSFVYGIPLLNFTYFHPLFQTICRRNFSHTPRHVSLLRLFREILTKAFWESPYSVFMSKRQDFAHFEIQEYISEVP